MSTTFQVADVKPGKSMGYYANCYAGVREPGTTTSQQALEKILNAKVEACSQHPDQIQSFPTHGLFEALRIAFGDHYPLILNPDDIWLTITQGLATHITKNAEQLRAKFVKHSGQKQLLVRRDSFTRGNPQNPWEGVFGEFSAQIQDDIGTDNHRMIVADFSTTTPVKKAASEVVLMDAMQKYFNYVVATRCGIPEITLEGSVEDWERLAEKTKMFQGLGLDWWYPALQKVTASFVDAAKGNIDKNWWNSCYKYGSESGGDRVSGWMTWLLPYVRTNNWSSSETVTNTSIGKMGENREGLSTRRLPIGVSRVPFIWDYYGEKFPYEFAAGFTGVEQDRTSLAVKPVIGWAVLPKQEAKSPESEESDY